MLERFKGDAYHPIWPDQFGQVSPAVPEQNRELLEKGVVYVREVASVIPSEVRLWGNGEKPLDEAYREALSHMSNDEKKEYFRRQRALALKYDGPGGP